MLDIYLAAGAPNVEANPVGIDLTWCGRDGLRVVVGMKRKAAKRLISELVAALDESRESEARITRMVDPS
jgi:hypothetical protein